jgi:hypothetical protein
LDGYFTKGGKDDLQQPVSQDAITHFSHYCYFMETNIAFMSFYSAPLPPFRNREPLLRPAFLIRDTLACFLITSEICLPALGARRIVTSAGQGRKWRRNQTMCRLFAITSETPLSPMVAMEAMDVMREGHDGSGVGLFLRDLSGPFEEMKDAPILSGIFSEAGIKRLDRYMMDLGFMTKYKISIKVPKAPLPGTPRRDLYLIRAYEYPEEWEDLGQTQIEDRLVQIRLELREMGQQEEDMIVFSFWPDVIMIKEIGDPMTVARYLGFDRKELNARIIMAQGRQNTNYAINLYACHPFFCRGSPR